MIREMGKRAGVTGIMIALGVSGFLSGCSVQGDSEPLVTLSPESAVVTLGATKQFTLATGETAATWSVNNVEGGNSTVGTISSDGLYTAPPLGAIDTTEIPEHVSIKGTDNVSGVSGSARAFLTTFKANTRLTQYTAGAFIRADTYSSGQRNIAVYKDENENVNVYCVWSDKSQGPSRIWFTKSSDGGDNFDTPVSVPADEGIFAGQLSPAITVDGSGNVFVVWEDYREGDADILIKRYDGTGFTSQIELNQDILEIMDYDTTPSIAAGSNDIYVVWEHRDTSSDLYPDIYFARSSNGGITFTQGVIANSGRRPAVTVDSSGIAYVVWEDLTGFSGFLISSNTHIKMMRIENGVVPGITKQIDSPLSPYDNARFPAIAAGTAGKVYVVWERALILDPGFAGETIFPYYIDFATVNGPTLDVLSPPLLFPDIPNVVGVYGGPAYPAITTDVSGNIYVAWDDQRNGTKDIYFAKSSNGTTFTTNRIVNDETGTWHEKPSIAVSEGKAFVIWTDYRNTSTVTTISPSDVFFAKEE